MSPLVWTVVLSWNGRDDTLSCLESLYQQTHRPDTILVVDNGSQDGLKSDLKKQYPRVLYHQLPTNQGFAAGMNVGLKQALAAGADFILAPNNDTRLDRFCLEMLLAAMQAQPRAGIVSPKILLSHSDGLIYFNGGYFSRVALKPIHAGEHQPDPNPSDSILRRSDFLNGCCPFFRCRALQTVGLYNERYFAYFEDADLSWRMREQGWELWVAPAARIVHEDGASFAANAEFALQGRTTPLRWFLGTRNWLWFLRAHGTQGQWILGGGWILASRILIAIFLALRGRVKKSIGIFQGLREGFFPNEPTA